MTTLNNVVLFVVLFVLVSFVGSVGSVAAQPEGPFNEWVYGDVDEFTREVIPLASVTVPVPGNDYFESVTLDVGCLVLDDSGRSQWVTPGYSTARIRVRTVDSDQVMLSMYRNVRVRSGGQIRTYRFYLRYWQFDSVLSFAPETENVTGYDFARNFVGGGRNAMIQVETIGGIVNVPIPTPIPQGIIRTMRQCR